MIEPNNFTQKREKMSTTYSELGKKIVGNKKQKDHWGFCEHKGRLILFYTDPKLIKETFTNRIIQNLKARGITTEQQIKIADFGGGDGVLLNTITKQLAEEGYNKIEGVNIDFTPKHLETMQDKFISKEDVNRNRKIYGILGDLTNIPLETSSVDVGYSRSAIQYISKENQPIAIQEMLRVLKPDAELIVTWPWATNTEKQSCFVDEFDANIDSIITNIPLTIVKGNRHLISLEEMGKITESLGVNHKISYIENLTMFLSSEIYADRFNIKDKDKIAKLRNLFSNQDLKKKDTELGISGYIEEDGKTYIICKFGLAVLKKAI
ncbi:MAG: class I SAM-dependent methyltransferase [bacterium]